MAFEGALLPALLSPASSFSSSMQIEPACLDSFANAVGKMRHSKSTLLPLTARLLSLQIRRRVSRCRPSRLVLNDFAAVDPDSLWIRSMTSSLLPLFASPRFWQIAWSVGNLKSSRSVLGVFLDPARRPRFLTGLSQSSSSMCLRATPSAVSSSSAAPAPAEPPCPPARAIGPPSSAHFAAEVPPPLACGHVRLL